MATICQQGLPSQTIQVVVVALLKADLVASVFDYMPEDEPYPYVVVGEDFIQDLSTKRAHHVEVVLRIHVWTGGDDQGWNPCNTIMDTCSRALIDHPRMYPMFAGANWRLVDALFHSANRIRESALVRHGILEVWYSLDQLS